MIFIKLKDWIGIIGGVIGVCGALVGVSVAVCQYFATRADLVSVDCRYKHKVESLESSLILQVYSELYEKQRQAAVRAEAEHLAEPGSTEKLAAFRVAVDEQDGSRRTIDEAKANAKLATEALESCGTLG